MISKVNIFIVTIFVLLVTKAGFAQESITDENRLGTAYEFSGVSKFITFPSKFLFGNPEVLEAEIVVGYRGNLFEIVSQCPSLLDYQILLGRVESEWWNESTYTNIPQSIVSVWTGILLEESRSNQEIRQSESPVLSELSNSWEDMGLAPGTIANFDIAILDIPEQQFNDECVTNFDRTQFLVDERIAQLANAAGLQSGINNLGNYIPK